MDEKGLKMHKKRLLGIFLVFALCAAIFLPLLAVDAEAGPKEILGEINSFFKDEQGYKEYSNLIDFMIFFVLFFSVAYLGFSKWFGDGFGKAGSAKGAVVGLSIAMGLALSLGLVISGKFQLTDMVPIAKNVIFIVLALLFFGLLSNDGLVGKDTTAKKILAAMLAIALAYVAMNFLTWGVCTMEMNNDHAACQGGVFTAASKGVDYLFGDGSGGGSGSPGSTGSSRRGGTGSGSTKTLSWSEGICAGGLRMDGTFSSGTSKLRSEKAVRDFITAAKQKGKSSVRVYTFPPAGGDRLEAEIRADVIGRVVESAGGTTVDAAQSGFFNGADDKLNDRFILSTDPIAPILFMPERLTLNTRTICGKQSQPIKTTKCDDLDPSKLTKGSIENDVNLLRSKLNDAESDVNLKENEMKKALGDNNTDKINEIKSQLTTIEGAVREYKKQLGEAERQLECLG